MIHNLFKQVAPSNPKSVPIREGFFGQRNLSYLFKKEANDDHEKDSTEE